MSERSRRRLLRSAVGTAAVLEIVGLSGTASAHGFAGRAEVPVTFAVVVGLPIAVGLGGGAIALWRLRAPGTSIGGIPVGVVLGLSLAALGLTFATSAVGTSHPIGLAGGAVGAVSVYWATRRGGSDHRVCRADLALGAVSAHRLLEGVAIGALYSAGAAVGVLGAVLLAGHAAVETAAIGGTYATRRVRARAIAVVLVVQLTYAGGAVVGLGVADALPASARAFALAVTGGVLLVVGASEAGRSFARDGRHPRVRG